jgi:integrase
MHFYLKRNPNGYYYVTWTDRATGNTQHKTTGTKDKQDAEVVLAQMTLGHRMPRDLRPEQVKILEIVVAYAINGSKKLATKLPLKRALVHCAEYLGDVTLAQFTTSKQKWFIEQLAEGLPPIEGEEKRPPLAGPTIQRRLTVIQCALNFAGEEGTIDKADVPKLSKPEQTYREGFGQRPFTLEEVRAIFAAARSENERKMLLVWVSTMCRPAQILDLTGDRIRLDEHSIDFRVPGAVITKKRRAKVMMCPSVYAYLTPRWESGLLVYNTTKDKGTKLKGFTNHIRRLVERAGIQSKGMGAYRIRKFAASYLANRGIADVTLKHFLAHKLSPEGETWRYIEADLPPAVRVLEAMLKEINPPWLSFAGDLLVSPVNPLFSLVVANDPQ